MSCIARRWVLSGEAAKKFSFQSKRQMKESASVPRELPADHSPYDLNRPLVMPYAACHFDQREKS